MSATLAVRHNVRDYAAWRKVYDELQPLRTQYGCTAQRVMQLPDDGNALYITHDFPTVRAGGRLRARPGPARDHGASGGRGAPRIEIFTDV